MRRFLPGSVLCLLILVPAALAREITIHGFVTKVKSPTKFEIDNYRISRRKTVALQVDTQYGPGFAFRPEDIRIGTELEIRGEYNEASGKLKAKSVKVFPEDTQTIGRTAWIEQAPALTKDGAGWKGEIRTDGERILVVPTTSVTFGPNRFRRRNPTRENPRDQRAATVKVFNRYTFVHYQGTRGKDGSIIARRVELQNAPLGQANLWSYFEPRVPRQSYKMVPSRQVQEYVSRLGESLIPAHQRELSSDNPLKIPFRFFVVEAQNVNAVTYPNGVVVVHSGVFDIVQNEAQLAFVLAHEISHAVENHAWQQRQYYRQQLLAFRRGGAFVPAGATIGNPQVSGIQSVYACSLENQADRVGLEWMLAAGYDIRQAPAFWKSLSKKKGNGPICPSWNSYDDNSTRGSYLMARLRNNYADVDYSKLKKDSEEFHRVSKIVKGLETKK